MARTTFTILGCGSSGGVPRLGGDWGDCDPTNPKNKRRRCSLLIEQATDEGTTRVLIDTSPDMREQLLDARIGTLDGVVYTHAHADHTNGIDDLRQIVFNLRKRLDVWADAATRADLLARFAYAFVQPEGSGYPVILNMHLLDGPVTVTGSGGDVTLIPLRVDHGGSDALGFRIGDLAYLPDVVDIPAESWPLLANLDCWILDALRRTPHPTHAHLALSLDWIARARPKRAVLTNMHLDMDYATLCDELAAHVRPAFDGMKITTGDSA
jgi:phosphoribosyl 1,2-cyclic phosphate phosphodiesterase